MTKTERLITDHAEIERLASMLFRFKNSRWGSAHFMQTFAIDMLKHAFSIHEVTHDPIPARYLDVYIEKYGEWKHGEYGPGGRCSAHNELGMKWAAWMQEGREDDICIDLTDSPDIGGWIRIGDGKYHLMNGDIGQCSWLPAMLDTLNGMHAGDLWISVISDTTEYTLESQFNVSDLYVHWLSGDSQPPQTLVERRCYTEPPFGHNGRPQSCRLVPYDPAEVAP